MGLREDLEHALGRAKTTGLWDDWARCEQLLYQAQQNEITLTVGLVHHVQLLRQQHLPDEDVRPRDISMGEDQLHVPASWDALFDGYHYEILGIDDPSQAGPIVARALTERVSGGADGDDLHFPAFTDRVGGVHYQAPTWVTDFLDHAATTYTERQQRIQALAYDINDQVHQDPCPLPALARQAAEAMETLVHHVGDDDHALQALAALTVFVRSGAPWFEHDLTDEQNEAARLDYHPDL